MKTKMKKRTWVTRALSGMLSAVLLLGTAVTPMTAMASELTPEEELKLYVEALPELEDVKDQLDPEEVVTAKDYEVDYGAEIDLAKDFTNLEIPDQEKVKVNFYEAKNAEKEDFNSSHADTYKAVYYVEPQQTEHPVYKFSRNLIVKEPVSEPQTADESDGSGDTGQSEDDGDAEAEPAPDLTEALEETLAEAYPEESVSENPVEDAEEPETVQITEPDTEIADLSPVEEMTDETKLDLALEEIETQDTYDEMSGLTLSGVLRWATEEEDIDFAAMGVGETVSFSMPGRRKAAAKAQSVDITRGSAYYYADYGLGSYVTFPYTVQFGTVKATAYCVQPSRSSPGDGTFTITKLKDGKALAKVCYYGTKASGDDGFFAEKHPDFSTGKRFIITHIAAAYANGSSDAFSGTNATGQALAMELYNYCMSMPEIPDVDMEFSEDNVTAYIEGNIQRTKVITFKADELQSITFKLPQGVKLHNETTGQTSKAAAEVEINGGTKFYFTAPLTQVSDVSASWHAKMKGSVTKDYSAYKITTGSDTQDLALVFGEAVEKEEKYVEITVNWLERSKLTVTKTDESGSVKLSGAVFGVYSDKNCANLIAKMPETDETGTSTIELDVTGTVYLKELTSPKGYLPIVTAEGVTVKAGETTIKTVPNKEIKGKLTIFKEGEVLTGADVTDAGTTFRYEVRKQKGASFNVYAGAEIKSAGGRVIYKKGDLVKENLTTGADGSVSVDDLYLGTYTVKETGAPKNFVTKGESKDITLSLQNLSGEVAMGTVTFKNDRQKAEVSVVKQDNVTKNPLKGGIYGLFAGEDIENADGKIVVKKDTLIQKATTGADGKAAFTADLPINSGYYVKEVQAPPKYVRNERNVFAFDFRYTTDKEEKQEFSHTFENERVSAKIHLVKLDSETGEVSQGDASLEGAVYGLYAREDIVHPDGATGVLYQAGAQVAVLKTDKDGKAVISDLYLGKYYVKETIPSEGYLLDPKEYDLSMNDEGDQIPVVEKTATSKEQVIKQPFQVIKAANNGKTDADLLIGVGFSAYLISSLEVKKDGSYDFAKAQPVILTADGKTEMFTDAKGYAVSIPIPYGKYVVRETTTPHNYTPVDDFEVTITENHPEKPQEWRVLLDDEFEAKLKIVKKDDETKKSVLLPGAEFKVYDLDHGKYVEQVTTYPSTVTHKSYFTDKDGYLILPNNLKIGHYRIEEVTAPEGYVLNHETYEVLVDSNTAYQMDSVSGDAVIEVTVENQPVKGKLTIKKSGETLKSYDKDFGYEVRGLSGAEFAVYAAEDIYTPDHQKDEAGNRITVYKKDALVAAVTTNEIGEATVTDLPLGTYRIEETKAPYGFVLNANPQIVAFKYQDQETPVIEQTAEFVNERQKVEITVEKQDAETGKKLAGAVFGLYAKDTIFAADAETVLMDADTLLEETETDKTGLAVFKKDLPLGQYYVKETKAPAGYVSSDEVIALDAGYQGQEILAVKLSAVKKNEPTTTEFTKSDITTGTELDGATLTVLTKKGDVVERWTSVKNSPHVIKCLTAGESYVLREEFAPYGYLKATDVSFTVEDTAEIQKVEMKDEVPTALLIINKNGEFLDKVSLIDSAKGTIAHLFSYISGGLTPVTFEVYAAENIKAADGVSEDYFKENDLVGSITTDDTGIAKLGDLPVGKYYVKEVETAHGYVLDGEIRYVDLSYRDQDTPIVVYDEKWQNARQKIEVQLVKKEKGTDIVLRGAVFGLYAAEDIKAASGKTLLKKDTLIEQKTTDADGKILFLADLPVDGHYYVKEISASDGYVTAGESQDFVFTYEESDKEVVTVSLTFENEPTTVELSKADLTTGKELPGARLRLIDENGTTVEEWISMETPHIIQRLIVGETYELIETKPADGYVTAESVVFTVENTAEIQKVAMEDDVTKVEISKRDITSGEELPGAKLTILDQSGKVVETWISEEKPHYIEKLPIGEYTLREETAPDGYLLAEEMVFTVDDTAEIQKADMKDDYTKVRISKQDITTGEELPGAKLTILDQDGKEVASWTSEDKPHYIDRLPVGEYVLREVTAPDGYEVAEDVKFTIAATGEVQQVVMKDAPKETPETPAQPVTPETSQVSNPPKTGDDSRPFLWMALAVLSFAMLAGIGLAVAKKKSK